MSSIILAFIIGVLCGMGYMYLRYNKMISNNLRELEEIRLMSAKTDGLIDALCAVDGIDRDNFAQAPYMCDGTACVECDPIKCREEAE